jgi:phosphohistidine swiveling domain-containing protein
MSLESRWPSVYAQLLQAGQVAERHLRDIAEFDFTVVNGRLFVTQLWRSKRGMSPMAQIQVELQLLIEGAISTGDVLERIRPAVVAALLRPEITDTTGLKSLGKGLPVGGGAASGRLAFATADVERQVAVGDPSLLVVRDLSLHELEIASASEGVLATTGGHSSHTALLCGSARKPCVVNFKQGELGREERVLRVPGFAPLREGDWLTIDGMTGDVYAGKAQVETRPWKSHPELAQLALVVEQAVASGHVPPGCAGGTWRIWDFLRHGLPLPGQEIQTSEETKRPHKYPPTAARDAADARRTTVPISSAECPNYSGIVLGLMKTLDRQFRAAVGTAQPYCRVPWDPGSQLDLRKCRQLVGLEFFGINRRIPHLLEISDVRLHLECEVESPTEAWSVESVPGFGLRVVPGARTIRACRVTVNGAQLEHEDIPKFYTWLRRREYFWQWFEEHDTSHRKIAAFLRQFARTRAHDPKLSVLCRELGLLKNGRLTVAGLSLAGAAAGRK